MRTLTESKIEQNQNNNVTDRPSAFRRTVALLTLVAYIGQPVIATAEIIADQAAAPNNRPVIDITANGLPLVQIATPSAAGVSHNQYTQFNVGSAGVILNNSQTTAQTQQAGYVSANQNLANGTARIILNEVTSTSTSQLNGYIEVAGQQAEVIIANPNGITCNGCGFINTSRGLLTTGTPEMSSGGSIDNFRVTTGEIQIGTAGMNGSNLSQFDLIARSVKVNGELWATNLNVITGANLVNYNTLGVQIIQGTGVQPTVGIDVALLGGMYANKIRLIGTEAGVGVNSLGNLSAQAGDFILDNVGQITLNGSTTASGNLSINSNSSITNGGTVYSRQATQLTSTGAISNSGQLFASGDLILDAASVDSTGALGAGIDSNGIASLNGNLLITSQNQTSLSGQNISGNSMSITANSINLANSYTNAWSGINLNTTGGDLNLVDVQMQTTGDIALNAAGAIYIDLAKIYGTQFSTTSDSFHNNGDISVTGVLGINSSASITNSGNIYSQQTVQLISAGSITNSGAISAQGDLSLNADSLNSSGTLASGIDINGAATKTGSILITTQNQTAATGQNISGGGMSISAASINLANSATRVNGGIGLTATAGGIDLTGAQMQTIVGNIVLNATGVVNTSTSLLFGADITSDSASFINTGGSLGATGNIYLTAGNSIDNSGLILAQGDLSLNANSLNSTGTLASGIDSNGVATKTGSILITTQNQTAATGQNISGGGMSISATRINLANSATSVNDGISLTATAGGIDLTGAQMQSMVGNIVLSATGVVNTSTSLLLGANITSDSARFINNGGSLGATGNIYLTAASIDNTNGRIGNALHGAGNIILSMTGNLTNIGGQIDSDRNLLITANTLVGNGQAIAGRDASISLTGDYTNAAGNVLKANRHLTLSTTGNFTNQTTLEAVGTLSVNAVNIDNQSGALINANLSKLTATGDITNAGRLEGNTVETHSINFNNTSTVMGGILNLYANNLDNRDAAAIIGATQGINLTIANMLNNQDGANILSLGDINIGANLAIDPITGYLAGNAVSVTNQSATIEAWGDMRISADTITNKRTQFSVATNTIGTATVVGTPSYNGTGGTPSYTSVTTQEVATSTPEASLKVGGNAWFKANAINNEYSAVAVAGTETFSATLNQTAQALNQVETRVGTQENYAWGQTSSWWGMCGSWLAPYPCIQYSYGWIYTPLPYNATITTQTGSVDATHTAAVIQGSGASINNQTISSGAVGGTAATVGATLGTSQGYVAPSGGTTTPSNVAVPSTAVNVTGAVTVPSSGLYTLQTQPNQTYLVVTDQRFTSYQDFVSSDYMLGRLSLDPQLIQKRLGDGFYEQKLVLDQITDQTGLRYLGQYNNANEQYTALLDAGATAAQELNLVPGITLTAAQVDALTADIVWLVDQLVALPDGTTQHVLAPKLYLTRLHEADLQPNGALIAAEQIDLTIGGSMQNSGTIKAGSSLSIQAQDIINRGGTIGSTGTTTLNAVNDILNQSGNINGVNVSLLAGRDMISERLTESFAASGYATNLIHGMAGITASGTLDIYAGRDAIFAASNLSAGGNASVVAGRDITFSTIATQVTATNSIGGTSRTEQLTSGIMTGGNLMLNAANDIRLTSAALNIGRDATLIAGGNLTLDASKNTFSANFNNGTTNVRQLDETVLGTTLSAGGNVTMLATRPDSTAASATEEGSDAGGAATVSGGNITLSSATISSANGTLALVADGDINIGTVDETHESYRQTTTQSSDILSTSTTTQSTQSSRTTAIGSSLTGTDIILQAGNQETLTGDITIQGSSIAATEGVSINAGHDLNILSAENTASSGSSTQEALSGFSAGSSGLEYGNESSDTITDSSITQSASSITGQTILTQSGNDTRISASDIQSTANTTLYSGGHLYIESAADTTTHNQETSESKVGLNVAMMDGRVHDVSVGTNSEDIGNGTGSVTQVGSQIGSQGELNLLSGGSMLISASQLTAGTDMNLHAAGDILLSGQYNQSTTEHSSDVRMSSMGSKDKESTETQDYTYAGASLNAGNTLSITAGNNIELAAAQLTSGGDTNLTAETGQVRFLAQRDISVTSTTTDDEDLVYEVHEGEGSQNETLVYTQINTGGHLNVEAAQGVVVEVEDAPPAAANATTASAGTEATDASGAPAPASLTGNAAALAQQPGMEWMGQMLERDDVDWQQALAAHENWDYQSQGLTEAGAIILTIVVTYFTAGTASSAVGSVTATTGSAAVGAAAGAAVTSLATTAAVSFANNGGDLGQTLEDLGRSENIRGLLTAMVTAGVLSELNTTLGTQNVNANSGFTEQLQHNLTNNLASATIDTAINGGDLGENLQTAVQNALIDTGAAQSADWIGDQNFDNGTHQLAHAIAGCAAGAARAGDCSSGALGAVIGEIAAELYAPDNGTPLTDLQRTDTINFSRLMAGAAAAITGGDVNVAAAAGGDAAENNRLMHFANFEAELASCQNSNSTECQTLNRMAGVQSTMPEDNASIPDSQVVANLDANGQVVSYTLISRDSNQPQLIMEPTDFAMYSNAGQANQGWMALSPQWSLDIGSGLAYAGQGDTTSALEHMGYAASSPEYWATVAFGVVGGAWTLPGRTVSNSTALSTFRYTAGSETFFRYESANPMFTKITPSGGVAPGTFAAPASDGLVPLADRVRVYNLPSAEIPRPTVITLTPPQGTLIVGPRPVVGGTGNEVIFPAGY